MADRVTFTRGAAERIARVVRHVELGNRDSSWSPPPPRDAAAPNGKIFHVGKFTGAWNINTAKTVTFINQTTTPNTVSAQNIFVTISGTTVTSTFRNCAIAKDGTAWYLIAAQC